MSLLGGLRSSKLSNGVRAPTSITSRRGSVVVRHLLFPIPSPPGEGALGAPGTTGGLAGGSVDRLAVSGSESTRDLLGIRYPGVNVLAHSSRILTEEVLSLGLPAVWWRFSTVGSNGPNVLFAGQPISFLKAENCPSATI